MLNAATVSRRATTRPIERAAALDDRERRRVRDGRDRGSGDGAGSRGKGLGRRWGIRGFASTGGWTPTGRRDGPTTWCSFLPGRRGCGGAANDGHGSVAGANEGMPTELGPAGGRVGAFPGCPRRVPVCTVRARRALRLGAAYGARGLRYRSAQRGAFAHQPAGAVACQHRPGRGWRRSAVPRPATPAVVACRRDASLAGWT